MGSRIPRRASSGVWLMLLFACGDGGTVGKVGIKGTFEPSMIDFQTVIVGQTARQSVVLHNAGVQSVVIQDVRFDPPSDIYSPRTADGATLRGATLPSSGELQLTVLCAPTSEGDLSTKMIAVLGTVEVSLPIHGVGRMLGPPVISADPGTITFAPTEIGRDAKQPLRITNTGEVDGVLQEVRPKSSGADNPFSVTLVGGGNAVQSTVARGGGTLSLEVHFRPQSATSFQQDLELVFVGGVTVKITVAGTGAMAGQLSCDTTSVDFGQVTRGTTATHPVHCTVSGGIFTLDHVGPTSGTPSVFTVPNPPAAVSGNQTLDFSIAFLPEGRAQTIFTGMIEVVGATGSTVLIGVDGQVIAPPPGTTDITATLSWNTPHVDLDLHLTRNGSQPFDAHDDCYYFDKNPQWGNPADESNHPWLDRDATCCYGPEQINLTHAAESNYDLYVHWYNYSSSQAEVTTARIEFSLRGGALQTFSQTMSTCGQLWHVGTFHMDTSPPSFQPDSAVTDWKNHAAAICQ